MRHGNFHLVRFFKDAGSRPIEIARGIVRVETIDYDVSTKFDQYKKKYPYSTKEHSLFLKRRVRLLYLLTMSEYSVMHAVSKFCAFYNVLNVSLDILARALAASDSAIEFSCDLSILPLSEDTERTEFVK